jgi:hypothetical protein
MRSTRSAAVLLLAAFLLGALFGAGGHLVADRLDRGPEHARRGGGRSGYLDHLTRELALTEVQRDSVRVVLERHRPAMDSLRREIAPRFETLQLAIRSDIRTQLTPDQQRKLDEMTMRIDAKRKHPGGPDAPR